MPAVPIIIHSGSYTYIDKKANTFFFLSQNEKDDKEQENNSLERSRHAEGVASWRTVQM